MQLHDRSIKKLTTRDQENNYRVSIPPITFDWIQKYAYCAGCEEGGGPTDYSIRTCAAEKGHGLCSQCSELDTCDKYGELRDPESVKEKLHRNKGKNQAGNR